MTIRNYNPDCDYCENCGKFGHDAEGCPYHPTEKWRARQEKTFFHNVLAMPLWRWAVVPTKGLAAVDCPGIPFYLESSARHFFVEAKNTVPETAPILVRRKWMSLTRSVEVIER